MSDEKKREELKAKINEGLDELSLEELEEVTGGYTWHSKLSGGGYCFTKEECDIIYEKSGVQLTPRVFIPKWKMEYYFGTKNDLQVYLLMRDWGVYQTRATY